MSWSEIFPVLTDEQVDEFLKFRSDEEVSQYEEWFGVQAFVPASGRPGSGVSGENENVVGTAKIDAALPHEGRKHVVSATLFWKHVNGGDPDLPSPNREYLTDARRLGLVKRFSPWESYIAPLVLRTADAVSRHPGVRFRLYLAADLEFLIPELSEVGWDVCLMKSPSIRYCPGGFWRFLALDEEDTLVTVIDTDRMAHVSNEICRSEEMDKMGLGLWRVPGYYNSESTHHVRYRPILGGHFGALGGIPARLLIEAFLWHSQRETIRKSAIIPGIGERPIQFSSWPSYGFDEWFQLAALYPRLVVQGTLTFIPKDARSFFLPVDLEYAQWANPQSESLYF